MTPFKSTHDLAFETAEWENPHNTQGWIRFRIGTCEGLWRATQTQYQILAVANSDTGNGHFQDVMDWFENSCKRDKKDFAILEVSNPRLKKHLLQKRKFKPHWKDAVVKKHKNMAK